MNEPGLNRIDAPPAAGPSIPGDVPPRIRRRYLGESGPGIVRFYSDATAQRPAFSDHGVRLTAERNDPHLVRDLVAIAQHRGWSAIVVRGQTDFRREVWLEATRSGLAVRGYAPRERDQGELARREARDTRPPVHQPEPSAAARETREIVEAVVRRRVAAPDVQERLLEAARSRIAAWLERGGFARPGPERSPPERRR